MKRISVSVYFNRFISNEDKIYYFCRRYPFLIIPQRGKLISPNFDVEYRGIIPKEFLYEEN